MFFDPKIHVQEACLTEIPNCQMLVLIIGGRHGSDFPDDIRSITNHEFDEAKELKIPVFALVEQSVLNDYFLYQANTSNSEIDADKISYPSADSTQIFRFIDAVQNSATNNALVPFRNFSEIESYLRQQWAGMMFSFLVGQNEENRVADTLGMLTNISSRVEMLSSQILQSVGTPEAKITAALYDLMIQNEAIRDMAVMGAKPKPSHVLTQSSFRECFKACGNEQLEIEDSEHSSVTNGRGRMSRIRFDNDCRYYRELRKEMLDLFETSGLNLDEYLASEPIGEQPDIEE